MAEASRAASSTSRAFASRKRRRASFSSWTSWRADVVASPVRVDYLHISFKRLGNLGPGSRARGAVTNRLGHLVGLLLARHFRYDLQTKINCRAGALPMRAQRDLCERGADAGVGVMSRLVLIGFHKDHSTICNACLSHFSQQSPFCRPAHLAPRPRPHLVST